MKYGIPYQGSKTKIADEIIAVLPKGKRFVDLFGGGFAMSHCALLSGKYSGVLYNELNPLLPPLIERAIRGDYSYERFKPPFISREEFFAQKDTDGYVRYIWSFGNNGSDYMFNREIEPLKRDAHNLIIFGAPSEYFPAANAYITAEGIHDRRMQWRQYCKDAEKRFDLPQLQQLEQLERLQQLERLEQLQQLERLEQLQQLELRCGSYLDYEYREGDVVYCDPPYEATRGYGVKFDSQQFYEWVASRPYAVYFSSYQSVLGFECVWAKPRRSSFGTGNQRIDVECLFWNGVK